MATHKDPFKYAHFEKTALTKTTEKRIRAMYSSMAKELSDRLDTLKLINPSDKLKKIYLQNMLKDVNKSIDELDAMIGNSIKNAGVTAGNIAVKAGNATMAKYGLEIKGAYSYIPHQEVQNIVSGGLYGKNWTLSQSIWKNGAKVKSDVESIVAKGLAENKPVKDIADALATHVNPNARKPWDWNKVYPGTAAKVDYNAQRLARTMIQHSYQQSLVQSQRYNPFCTGIIWWSVGEHGRTCAECMDRDGQVFPVAELPLDHPNGLCYFEPNLKAMDEIADDLADWALGGENAAIDTYIAKAFNLDPKSAAGKKAISGSKQAVGNKTAKGKKSTQTGKKAAAKKSSDADNFLDDLEKMLADMDRSQAAKEKLIDERFNNLRKKVVQSQKTKEAGENIWKELRKIMANLEEDHLKYMETGQDKLKAILPAGKDGKQFFAQGKNTITMDLVADVNNAKGAFTTFFHEYGHLLDHIALTPGHKHYFSFNSEFRKKLYFSLEKEYNKLLTKGGLRADVRNTLWKDDASNGVQDIISGLSMNKNRVKWGHDSKYWKAKGDTGISLEAVAHFNSALAHGQQAKYFEKYFPESYKIMKDELQRYLKAKGVK